MAFEKELEGTGNTRKGDSYSQVPASPFTVVAEGRQCTDMPTIKPNKTCTANIYRCVKRRKAVFLALKEFQDLCSDKIVLVATDNTTVVSYINKEGGMRSGPLCALLWRILTWCSRKQVTLQA